MKMHAFKRWTATRTLACLLMVFTLAGCSSVAKQDRAIAAVDPAALKAFDLQMLQAVDQKKVYPKEAIINGEQGVVVVSFDYVDGNRATNIHVWKSASKWLDKAAVLAVANVELPPKPAGFDDIIKFSVAVKFAFTSSPAAPIPAPLKGPSGRRSR